MATETRFGPKHEREGKTVKAVCSKCSHETNHEIIRSAEFTSEYADRNFSITGWDQYQIIECKGCQSISFRQTHQNTENFDIDPETGQDTLYETVEIFPHRLPGRVEIRDSYLLPKPISRVYEETHKALRGDIPVLAGIGMRALVEAICKDQGASGRDLEKKIDNLVDRHIFTRHGADILHGLRIMGNKAAHEVKPNSIDDLSTAMDVVDHALLGIYILPARAKTLPKRDDTDAKDRSTGGAA